MPKTARGQHREIEVACVGWIDLLGYGAVLEEGNFDPTHPRVLDAIARLNQFHKAVAEKSNKFLPSMVMNDGAAVFRDLSPRSRAVTLDFISRTFRLFSYISSLERKGGFPGARMIVSAGFRFRRQSDIRSHLINGIGNAIAGRIATGRMTVDQAINLALVIRPYYDVLPELQANFAFAKAYIADSGGSKVGLGGSSYYIDCGLFSTPPPPWLRFTRFIDWHARGLTGTSGLLDGIHRDMARKMHFEGALDAFEVAERIAPRSDIAIVLHSLKIRNRPPRKQQRNSTQQQDIA